MLLNGVNHVAVLTNDSARLHAFYQEVFDATVRDMQPAGPGTTLSFIDIGPFSELNVFEIEDNDEADRQTPMFGRGRLDHVGLQAVDRSAFDEIRERLITKGSTDGFVTNFGPVHSLFFVDPDGLEGEVCVTVDDWDGEMHPPGTPAEGYAVVTEAGS